MCLWCKCPNCSHLPRAGSHYRTAVEHTNSALFRLNLPRRWIQDYTWCIPTTNRHAVHRNRLELAQNKALLKCIWWKSVLQHFFLSTGLLPLVHTASYHRCNPNTRLWQSSTVLSPVHNAQLKTHFLLLISLTWLCWSKDEASEWGSRDKNHFGPLASLCHQS